ncbi:MAG TPA: sigma-54 dependent transcriptional regulator [Terriglobales bacterium]|jgi:DNA-binding NtrC family response regulator|nr:sigma-54 dependent transcriptional regulator [Terriglobales bacterium]
MSKRFTVLVVDDEDSTRSFLHAVLTVEGYNCQLADSLEAAEILLRQSRIDLALVDLYLGTANGLNVLDLLKVIQPQCKCVVMTAHATVETVARSLSGGALEYLSKPLLIDDLLALVRRVQSARPSLTEEIASEEPFPETAIVGRSAKMLEVYRAIARVAASNASVLITGASGTGKELVARAIHAHSARAQKPFIPINCGAFSETLLESELFGYEKGAFTGADSNHPGLFEAAHGGTIFLDEISETKTGFQVNLLRAVQEQQVRRVGSNKYIPIDVRILAASNCDLEALIQAGAFREDLYYRLSVVTIHLPTLAERREDIPPLIHHFLKRSNARSKRHIQITSEAVQSLSSMLWPGNVRELENFIERLAIFCASGEIGVADVEREAVSKRQPHTPAVAGNGPAPTLQEMERQHILRVLQEAEGNKSKAARALGIERKTLYEKARRLGIDLQANRR